MRREIVKEEKIHKISPLLVFNIYFGDTRGFPDSISEQHQPLHHDSNGTANVVLINVPKYIIVTLFLPTDEPSSSCLRNRYGGMGEDGRKEEMGVC